MIGFRPIRQIRIFLASLSVALQIRKVLFGFTLRCVWKPKKYDFGRSAKILSFWLRCRSRCKSEKCSLDSHCAMYGSQKITILADRPKIVSFWFPYIAQCESKEHFSDLQRDLQRSQNDRFLADRPKSYLFGFAICRVANPKSALCRGISP